MKGIIQVDSFLGCFKLKTGVLTIAWMSIIQFVTLIFLCSSIHFGPVENLLRNSYFENISSESFKTEMDTLKTFSSIVIFVSVLALIFYIVLLNGIHKVCLIFK